MPPEVADATAVPGTSEKHPSTNRPGEGDSPIFLRRPSAADGAYEKIGTVPDGSDQSFADLLEKVTRNLEVDGAIDLDELVRSHPLHAERLRRVLPAMAAMASWARDPKSAAADAARTPAPAHAPGVLGDFRIIDEIGRGGMGVVYEAEQISLRRRVALKTLPFAAVLDKRNLQRFKNEALAAATLDHPNIVSVYAVGEERGVHFFAMQLIRGQTLAEMICQLRKEKHGETLPLPPGEGRREGPSSCLLPKGEVSTSNKAPTIDSAVASTPATKRIEQARISTVAGSRHSAERYRSAARLGIQAAEALQHAHDAGVLHRDIKPGNLMLDADGQLYITDFGLARMETDVGMTMTGDLVGTLRYMAPEQALAKRIVIDHRADVYSLGATLYELLTLEPAFGQTDRSELLKHIAFEEPRPPRKLDRRIPAELETIVLKAMAKSPDERYQTAQRLADDLRAFIEHKPIKAKPPTVVQRALKWSRRHRTIVAAVGFAVVGWLVAAQSAAIFAFRVREKALHEASALAVERDFATASLAIMSKDIRRHPAIRLAETPNRVNEIPATIHKSYTQALMARKAMAAADPDNIDHRIEIAATHAIYSALLAHQGDLDAACNGAIQSLQILDNVYMNAAPNIRVMATAILRIADKLSDALPYSHPLGIASGPDGFLYVSCRQLDSVLRINLTDGRVVGEFQRPDGVLSPHGLAFGPDRHLYVAAENQKCIVRFDVQTGEYLGEFIKDVPHPVGVAFAPNGDFYVSCFGSREVRRYNVETGEQISVWRGADSDRLQRPTGMVFDQDGDLYVACQGSNRVERYSAPSGEFRGVFASGGGLRAPIHNVFGPDGNLYVAGLGSNAVHVYDGETGDFLRIVEPPAAILSPQGLGFSSSGDLFISGDGNLLRIDASSGECRGLFQKSEATPSSH